MSYKLIVLTPSTGGKSTLMRYLREHTKLRISESDEEVMKANNDVWPDDDLKNSVLIPQISKDVLSRDSVVYLASYVPDDLLKEAHARGFKIVLLKVDKDSLIERNKHRMSTENYQDATPWLDMQLDTFERLNQYGLIDDTLDGTKTVEDIAKQIVALVEN